MSESTTETPRVGTCCVLVRPNIDTFVPNRAPNVLAVYGKKGIGFPGGKIEPGETPVQAALRELQEETGLEAEDAKALPVWECDTGSTVHAFRVTSWSGTLKASPEGVPFWSESAFLWDPVHSPYANYNKRLLKVVFFGFPDLHRDIFD